MKKKISVVIPTYNEEGNVKPLAQAIVDVMEKELPEYNYEIIFIDNHSKDKTKMYLRQMCKENKHIKVLKRTLNHESIHSEQMKELGYIFFYIWYFIEWLIQLCLHGKDAYYWVSFEREAYDNEKNYKYLNSRKRYNWFKYYVNK